MAGADHQGPADLLAQVQCLAAEREHLTDELARSNDIYRSLCETMLYGVVFHDRDGTIVFANPAAERLLGLTAAEICNRTSADDEWCAIREDGSPFPGEEHPSSVAQATGQAVLGVTMGVRRPGEAAHIWLRINAIPQIRPGESTPWRVVVTFEDITEHRQLDERIRESEERYRLLFNLNNDAMCAMGFDADGRPDRFLEVNEALCQRYGYTRDELLEMGPLDLESPAGLARLPELVARLLSQRQATWESVHRTRDGREIPVEVTTVLFDLQGATAGLSTARDITERKQAEQALRTVNERLAATLAALPDILFEVDAQGIIYDYRAPDDERLYVPPSAFIGRDVRSLLPEPASRVVTAALAEAVASGSHRGAVYSLPMPAGTQWYELAISSKGAGGTLAQRLVVMVREVTERERALEALRRSEAELALRNRVAQLFLTVPDNEVYGDVLDVLLVAFESPHGAFGFIDDTGALVLPSLTRGIWSACQVADRTDVFPPETWGNTIWGRVIREQRGDLCNEGFSVPAGHIDIEHLLAVPVVAADRTVGLVLLANRPGGYTPDQQRLLEGIADFIAPTMHARQQRDLQERRRHEAEAEREETWALLQAAVAQSPSGILIADAPDVRIRMANQAGLTLRGETDQPLTDIAVGEHSLNWQTYRLDGTPCPPEELPLSRAVLKGETVRNEEVIIRDATGQDHIVSANAAPVRGRDGEVRAGVVIFHNITDRKRAEEQRLAFERQMQQAARLESLGVLAGGIAHDFNNLLAAILGHADLALEDLPDYSPARDSLLEITTAVQQASDLCRQMLAYAGHGPFVTESLSLSDLVSGTSHLLRSSISGRAMLDLRLAEGLPACRGDVSQVRQVLLDLVLNASEAIAERSGRITVSTGAGRFTADDLRAAYGTESPAPGQYAWLAVADTGCGMDAGVLQRMFEPFYTTKFTGRGLGLAATLGIVRGHRGVILVASEPGRGTTFRVLFPVAAAAPAAAQAAPAVTWRGSGTALLVDDEDTVRGIGRRLLERLGFEVVCAADGQAALDLLAAHRPRIRLVLLDLTMPHMGGEDAYRELRRLAPEVPVVLTSGYLETDVAARFADDPPAGFVPKPLSLSGLRDRLQQALTGAAA